MIVTSDPRTGLLGVHRGFWVSYTAFYRLWIIQALNAGLDLTLAYVSTILMFIN